MQVIEKIWNFSVEKSCYVYNKHDLFLVPYVKILLISTPKRHADFLVPKSCSIYHRHQFLDTWQVKEGEVRWRRRFGVRARVPRDPVVKNVKQCSMATKHGPKNRLCKLTDKHTWPNYPICSSQIIPN